MPVVGVVTAGSPDAPLTAGFRKGLNEAGYVESQRVARVDRRRGAIQSPPSKKSRGVGVGRPWAKWGRVRAARKRDHNNGRIGACCKLGGSFRENSCASVSAGCRGRVKDAFGMPPGRKCETEPKRAAPATGG
jgi:hypothetical protein